VELVLAESLFAHQIVIEMSNLLAMPVSVSPAHSGSREAIDASGRS
jgi:hypothetical protein